MTKTVLIAGATGLIGGYLINALHKRGDEYIAISHNIDKAKRKLHNAKKAVALPEASQLKNEKIDAVINLAGAGAGEKRWNAKVKEAIYNSRIYTTRSIVQLIAEMEVKPEVLVSASGVDYYGDRGNENVYEDSPNADTFMGNLCRDWEDEATKARQYGVRTAVLRTGFVLAREAKAVKKLTLPYKFFVGGTIGSGRQYVSWIHVDDLIGMYLFALDNINVSGAVNAASPNPATMKEFGKNLAKVLHRPSFMPALPFIVKIAAGEMAQVVLSGRRALPKKIMELGYEFKFQCSIDAWGDILK
jgi:uncharacterized protein (TIGR01777 family)